MCIRDRTISDGSNVTVEIEISKLATKKITIKSSNIKIINEDNTNAKVLDSVKFTVQGAVSYTHLKGRHCT